MYESDRYGWQGLIGTFRQRGIATLFLDMRGHGDIDWSSAGAYDVRDFAADLVAVASGMDRKPALVGASLGGLAGMIAEGDLAPGSFASLTLVDIAPRIEPGGVMRVVSFMQEHVETGFSSPEEAAQVIARYMPHRRKRRAGGGLRHYLRQKEDGRYYWHWDPAFIDGVMRRRAENGEMGDHGQSELSSAAMKLTLPVHLVRGGSSDLVSPEAVAHFRKLVPHAAYSDIADATHMVVGDQNDVAVFRELGLRPFVAVDLEGRMTGISGPLSGMSAEDARAASIELLSEADRLSAAEMHMQEVPVSERGGNPVEIIHIE
jgi:pimeloyl-ACP methyl ester carboxylesterase